MDDRTESWDRLAFLGDVVLSLAVSTEIYPRFPAYGAGALTKLRAQAVSRQACAEVARALGVPARLHAAAPAGEGRAVAALIESDRILASVCEAVIGATYLAFGFERVAPAVVRAFETEIERAVAAPEDFKSVLQEQLAQRGQEVSYRVDTQEGPPHDRLFVVVAEVEGREVGRGEGRTKKSAEQGAALEALGQAAG